MTGFEISVLCTVIATFGTVAIGVLKVFGGQTAAKLSLGKKPSDPPPRVDHGPCNEAVDELTEAIREDMALRREHHREDREQRREEMRAATEFREAFLRYVSREEGRREGARTGEFPVQG